MKQLVDFYTFNHATKQITFVDLPPISLNQVLLITNVTRNLIIYNFANPALGGTMSADGMTLTLNYDTTTAMTDSDVLQIYVDFPIPEVLDGQILGLNEQYSYDTNMANVFGTQPVTDKGMVKSGIAYQTSQVTGAIAGLGNAIGIDCEGMNTVVIYPIGTWVGTLTWEGKTNESANYTVLQAYNFSGQSAGTTSTSNVALRINCAGLKRIQLRFSAYTSGSCWVTMAASAAKVDAIGHAMVSGTLATLQQKATTFEALTWDTNLATILGQDFLYSPTPFLTADPALDIVRAPQRNPTQPTTYAANMFAKYPQRNRRLRVESGGSERLPFAQEPYTNRMLTQNPEAVSFLEQILIELRILNQNTALIHPELQDLVRDYNNNVR